MKQKKTRSTKDASAGNPSVLTGWVSIAKYLGQPLAVAQRWAKDGMPVRKSGRAMTSSPAELDQWLGRESGSRVPVHIARQSDADLLTDLRRGLREARALKRR